MAKKQLKYLEDMTPEDFDKIFDDGGTVYAESYKQEKIKSFFSLYGFMYSIALIGSGKSYPIAKNLGYDVEFTLLPKSKNYGEYKTTVRENTSG